MVNFDSSSITLQNGEYKYKTRWPSSRRVFSIRFLDSTGGFLLKMHSWLFLALFTLSPILISKAQDTSQALIEVEWMTSNERVNNLVSAMTPDEKISLVHHTLYSGSQDFAGCINAIPRLGILAIQMADGECKF